MSKLLVLALPALMLAAPVPAQQAPRGTPVTDDAPQPSPNAKKAWFRSAVDAILSGEDTNDAAPAKREDVR